MLNYIKIAFRNLKRFKIYTLINLFGLAMGLTVGILIILYVSDELGYDKFNAGNTSDLIAKSSDLWKEYLGDYTYEYFFLDQEFDKQYKSEDRLMTILIVFAVLTTLIAVIGLLGLVSFMVLSKTKEIGIRKVLGADTIGLAGLLSKEFAYLILIANILIAPVVWHYGQQWLNDFAFHTDINPMIFVISLVTTLIIALVTVSFQTIKAAQTNPVNTLRGE